MECLGICRGNSPVTWARGLTLSGVETAWARVMEAVSDEGVGASSGGGAALVSGELEAGASTGLRCHLLTREAGHLQRKGEGVLTSPCNKYHIHLPDKFHVHQCQAQIEIGGSPDTCLLNQNDVFRITQKVGPIFFNSGQPTGYGDMCLQIKPICTLVHVLTYT